MPLNSHNADMQIYTLHFDGSCGPKNPGGTAAYGFTIHRGAERLRAEHGVIGTGPGMTNNLAEYAGLYEGLAAFSLICDQLPGERVQVNVRGDSQLVIRQMKGEWGAKSDKAYYPNYRMTLGLVKDLRKRGVMFDFQWIPRELNQDCDDLSKAHDTVS